ncbi:MAG: hydrolase [Veillonella caviae]|nr:hydrolase [Veillonella caviae]
MHESKLSREQAVALLKEYNKEPFHLQHAFTVEAVMKWFAKELGYEAESEYWGTVGLLHDLDFEMYPEEHCVKAQELLKDAGAGEDMIYSICCHGYGLCIDWEPKELMEKVLYASDELTGLIGAAALMRPSKSTKDMELKSLKKKFKDKKFAAGCSRDVIRSGADLLGWELDELLSKTLTAMQANEDEIIAQCEAHQ